MKLCYFGSDYSPTGGGISTYTTTWLSTISKSDEIGEIKAFMFGNQKPREEKVNNKLSVVTLKDKNFFVIGMKILYFVFKNRDAQVLHALYVFPVGFWVVVWSKLFNIPSIVTIYGTDVCSKEGSRITRGLKRFTLMQTTKIIPISQFTKGASIKALSLSRNSNAIEVIYNTVPEINSNQNQAELQASVRELKEKLSINDGTFVVLSVCRLVERKGVDDLILAIDSIPNPNIKLLIVGDGPERKNLEKLIFEKKLQNRMFLLGKIPDLVPIYKISKIAVLASFARVEEGDFEGLGLVLLQAQSFDLPVIGTNSGGISETFAQGKTGLLVPEKDHTALVEAIETLYKDQDLYAKMSAQTKGFLEHKFGEKRMIQAYVTVIQSIIHD